MEKEKPFSIEKRNRGSNFTKEEEFLLLSEILKHKNIIENKLTDKINMLEKNEAWREILSAFNSHNSYNRTVDQLKIKYDNLKTKARKLGHGNKPYVNTGGYVTEEEKSNMIIEMVWEIINTVKTDKGNRDSTLQGNSSNATIEGNSSHSIENSSLKEISTCGEIQENGIFIVKLEPKEEETVDVSVSRFELQSQDADPETTITDEATWKSSKELKMKRTKLKKFRETIRNPIKDAYYRRKAILIQEKIKQSRLQQEEILHRQMLADEEHQKKMQLMDLDIKIKKTLLDSSS